MLKVKMSLLSSTSGVHCASLALKGFLLLFALTQVGCSGGDELVACDISDVFPSVGGMCSEQNTNEKGCTEPGGKVVDECPPNPAKTCSLQAEGGSDYLMFMYDQELVSQLEAEEGMDFCEWLASED